MSVGRGHNGEAGSKDNDHDASAQRLNCWYFCSAVACLLWWSARMARRRSSLLDRSNPFLWTV